MPEARTPLEIFENIGKETLAMQEAIQPLAHECIEKFKAIRESADYRRIVEIASQIPPSHPINNALQNFIRVSNVTPNEIQMAFPPTPAPEILTPAAFKVPEAL